MAITMADHSPPKQDAASSDDSDYDPQDPLSAALDGDSEGEDVDDIGEDDDDDDDEVLHENDGSSDGEIQATVVKVSGKAKATLDGRPVELHLGTEESKNVIVVASRDEMAQLSDCISHENTASAIENDNYVARVVVESVGTDGTFRVMAVSGKDEIAMVADLFSDSKSKTPEWPTLVRECEKLTAKGLAKQDRLVRDTYGITVSVKRGKPKVALYSEMALEYARTANVYAKLFEQHRVKQQRTASRKKATVSKQPRIFDHMPDHPAELGIAESKQPVVKAPDPPPAQPEPKQQTSQPVVAAAAAAAAVVTPPSSPVVRLKKRPRPIQDTRVEDTKRQRDTGRVVVVVVDQNNLDAVLNAICKQ